ncbi:MAG: hypothetical protein VZR00_09360 [Lachnospiraceae bacterium]|nr:hypothetical protein [Lachnospiraceae bacterium]
MKSKNDFQNYYDKVIKTLFQMSEMDKNTFILREASLVPDDKQQKFLNDLRSITEDRKKEEQEHRKNPDLEEFWNEIQVEIESLSHEAYIDDQIQIDVIWDMSEKAVKYLKKNEEPWELRFQILQDIIDNDYYDYYGVLDPMEDLIKALCKNDDEWIKLAEYMDGCGPHMEKDAAEIYRAHGHMEKYVKYIENHLGRENAPYIDLISYYHANGKNDKAVAIAKEGLEKCKQDQTDILIFLIRCAQVKGDQAEVDKLIHRGKLRRLVNTEKVVIAYQDSKALDKWKAGELV